MKIVTGSYDRTLKVWDLMQKACKYLLLENNFALIITAFSDNKTHHYNFKSNSSKLL